MTQGLADRAPSIQDLERQIDRRLSWAGVLANGLGGLDVFLFLAFLSPVTVSEERASDIIIVNALAGALYLAITLPLGRAWVRRLSNPFREAAREARPLGRPERDAVLLMPKRFALISAMFWLGAAILAGVGNAFLSVSVGVIVFATVLLGGLTTGALCYLFAERLVRPLTALALEAAPAGGAHGLGVRARMALTWALVTAVPLLGAIAMAVIQLADENVTRVEAAGAVLFFAILALVLGLVTTFLTSRAVADPLAMLRAALARVEEGDFDWRVQVDDASEVGMLQAGFNRMTAGLAERERLRDLFGRHVGEEVMRAALETDASLGGEERDVAALFIDVVGSTSLASELPPAQVVALLNRFFRVVVEVTEAHHGFVNKFEGDGALCVFGAPVSREDPAGEALAAARELHARLRVEVPELDAAIGVSAGRAVAGNVGAERRFEYTVIGDPINEAARLCDLAKQRPELLLAAEAAVSRARPAEASRWRLDEAVVLRGRASPTRVAIPMLEGLTTVPGPGVAVPGAD
jgi:adenylate cyclase